LNHLPAGTCAPASGVRQVLARYVGRDRARAAALSELGAAGASRTWLVGAPALRYVLRRLSPGTTAARARFVTAVHHRAACGGCAPQLLANDAGERLTLHHGQYFQLVEYAGRSWDRHGIPAAPACAELGLALGRLHNLLAGFQSCPAAPRLAFPADPGGALRAAYAAHDHDGCPHVTARQALTAKLRRAEALSGTVLDVLADLPQQVIHGDVHPGNVLAWQRPRASAIPGISLIDFDRTRCAPAAYEVMRALVYCVRPAGPRSAFAGRAAAFLDGYLAVRPLSGGEIETMAVLYETVQVLDAYGLGTCVGASEAALGFGEARFALLYWLRRHGPAIVGLARQASAAATSPVRAR
jgi:Ser/Thr protein kinase RdoA (MazF antagonist)